MKTNWLRVLANLAGGVNAYKLVVSARVEVSLVLGLITLMIDRVPLDPLPSGN